MMHFKHDYSGQIPAVIADVLGSIATYSGGRVRSFFLGEAEFLEDQGYSYTVYAVGRHQVRPVCTLGDLYLMTRHGALAVYAHAMLYELERQGLAETHPAVVGGSHGTKVAGVVTPVMIDFSPCTHTQEARTVSDLYSLVDQVGRVEPLLTLGALVGPSYTNGLDNLRGFKGKTILGYSAARDCLMQKWLRLTHRHWRGSWGDTVAYVGQIKSLRKYLLRVQIDMAIRGFSCTVLEDLLDLVEMLENLEATHMLALHPGSPAV